MDFKNILGGIHGHESWIFLKISFKEFMHKNHCFFSGFQNVFRVSQGQEL